MQSRLRAAAMTLFSEHGYGPVSVAQIADAAGVTQRTFYRYFPDKREVLFTEEAELRSALRAAVGASADGSLRSALLMGAKVVAQQLQPQWRELRRRRDVVATSSALAERELSKLASWSAAIADALVQHGVDRARAELGGRLAIGVLDSAADEWLGQNERSDLSRMVVERFDLAAGILQDVTTPAR